MGNSNSARIPSPQLGRAGTNGAGRHVGPAGKPSK